MTELSLFNSLFNDLLGNSSSSLYTTANAPRVDITEEDKAYTLEMELPGRTENDVTIELDHDSLKIASKPEEKNVTEKKEEKKAQKYILNERRTCSFERRFILPSDVDTESIKANFKNGILTIKMDKKAIATPKRIAIEAC